MSDAWNDPARPLSGDACRELCTGDAMRTAREAGSSKGGRTLSDAWKDTARPPSGDACRELCTGDVIATVGSRRSTTSLRGDSAGLAPS